MYLKQTNRNMSSNPTNKELSEQVQSLNEKVEETNNLILIMIQGIDRNLDTDMEFLKEFKKVQDIDIMRNFPNHGEA